ncbi:MAG: GNAT family N-acyltransferase [Pseudomonadota bacterium]
MNVILNQVNSDIRIASLAPKDTLLGKVLTLVGPLLDRLLGIRGMRRIYEEHNLAGLDPQSFAREVVKALEVDVVFDADSLQNIPQSGPVLVVCNHPFGGMEAVIIIQELLKARQDTKVLGNTALQVFQELSDVMIFTNPLISSQRNLPSLRQALNHLQNDGLLLIFPAGRVSYYRKDLGRTCDHDWNRIVGHLLHKSDAALVPCFVSGSNSKLFILMGYIWARLKILMLPREMLKMKGKKVAIQLGTATPGDLLQRTDIQDATHLARLLTYLQNVDIQLPAAVTMPGDHAPLAASSDSQQIEAEIAALPSDQTLINYKNFVVCYGSQAQLPATVHEIARQRERVFRALDEGSGEPSDTDHFDALYVHLFVWDNKNSALLGAYRMGRADELRRDGDVYLSQSFEFKDEFFAEPSLELGRSFVTPEYQKNHVSLHLLWRGIGAYLRQHQQYRKLYGTVSLSRQFDLRSITAICDALIKPSPLVRARHNLQAELGPEWQDYKSHYPEVSIAQLSQIVQGIEPDNKDLPVLLRHYHKVGATFLAVSVDPNFNNTPGLLLVVDLDKVPEKKRQAYVA